MARGARRFAIVAQSIGLFFLGFPAQAETAHCDLATRPSETPCLCDLDSLRPLQGAVGEDEVKSKVEKIKKNRDKQRRKLECDPIKVIRGPGGRLFVTDHHHGAKAWLEAEYKVGFCVIQDLSISTDPKRFWRELRSRGLIRLADENGVAIEPEALPTKIAELPDDPYRTLAYLVRKNDGFCRAFAKQTEFVEFVWADWLRRRPELSAKASPATMLGAALELATSDAAQNLPGFRGVQPPGFECPPEEDESENRLTCR